MDACEKPRYRPLPSCEIGLDCRRVTCLLKHDQLGSAIIRFLLPAALRSDRFRRAGTKLGSGNCGRTRLDCVHRY